MIGRLPLELRSGLRTFTRSPGFTLLGVCTLAIGIAASSAIFSMINGVLLRPLPVAEADRLVRVTSDFEGVGLTDVGLAPVELFDLRERTDLFSGITGVYPIDANLTGGDAPERVEALLVDVGYFDLLGVSAAMGRTFTGDDYNPGISERVVISDGLWRRRFGADPEVIGRQVRLDEDLFTIVGVMPPEFWHPGQTLQGGVELWAPSGWSAPPFGTPSRQQRFLQGGIARLQPGVSLERVEAALEEYGVRMRAEFAEDYPDRILWRPRVVAVHDDLVGSLRPSLLLLFGAVGLLLLLACSSVANLQFARTMARSSEFAVRSALGASRPRVLLQVLLESLTFALAGGALGVLVAGWATEFMSSLGAIRAATGVAIHVDRTVLAFTLGVSILAGLLTGLGPALRSSKLDLRGVLQNSKDPTGWGRGRGRVRSVLVVVQYALAMVLLVSAALLVRSFAGVLNVPLGFEADRVLTANLWLPQPNDRATGPYFTIDSRHRFYRETLARLAAEPGVESAALTTRLPLLGGVPRTQFMLAGSTEGGEPPVALLTTVSAGYFGTMGIALRSGRDFPALATGGERGGPGEVVVSRRFVEQYLGERDPIGEQIRFGGPTSNAPWLSIVGVVDDVVSGPLDETVQPMIYRSVYDSGPVSLAVVVKSRTGPETVAAAVEQAVQGVDPDMPLFAVRPMDGIVADSMARRRVAMILFGVFAAIALVLATVGVYGVVSYSVAQRIPEIGLRIALGADRARVLRLIMRQGASIMGVGIALGAVAALALTRLLGFMLFGVSPTDATSLVVVTAILLGAGLAACWLPGRRAARLEPGRALLLR